MDFNIVSLVIVVVGIIGYALYKAYMSLPPKEKKNVQEILKNLKKGVKAYPYLVTILKLWGIDVDEGWEKAFDLLKKTAEKKGIVLTDDEWKKIGTEIKKQWYKLYKEITGEEWEDSE